LKRLGQLLGLRRSIWIWLGGAHDDLLGDRHTRDAFESLFHAARIAVMTYLSTEVSRWGVLRRALPEPYSSRSKEIIGTPHIEYFYNGNYPRERVEEEFNKRYTRVKGFIEELEAGVKGEEVRPEH